MESLLGKSRIKIKNAPDVFKRFIYDNILKSRSRLLAIMGARGSGKTTLLLQLGKERNPDEVFYIALDDLFFSENSLYETAALFSKLGGKLLLLDEVHKYPNWSREIKLIYDDLPELQVIFTSSSVLDIYRGESDLSRRALSIRLPELSFREFLLFYEGIDLPVLSLDTILKSHSHISMDLTGKLKPLKHFHNYIKTGCYPYYDGNTGEYYQKLINTVNLILDVDIQSTQNLDYQQIAKMKRLLYVIASNVPFTPNISKLGEKLGMPRNSLVQALQLLEKAELIHTLTKTSRSISILSKPDKIWLHNTNLYFAISGDRQVMGSVRETFLLQHLAVKHSISLPEKADFLVDNTYTFETHMTSTSQKDMNKRKWVPFNQLNQIYSNETGGKNKTQSQIRNIPDSYLIKDDLETGSFNVIPLWLFGFLY